MADKENMQNGTPAEETPAVQFKKDIKFLWIYATVFCLVVVILIAGSAVIQRKIHRQVEGYQSQAESAEQSNQQNQSRLKNVQDENKALKEKNEQLSEKCQNLENEAMVNDALLLAAQQTAEHTAQLSRVQYLYSTKTESRATMREEFEKIDPTKLTEENKEIYEYLAERLGK